MIQESQSCSRVPRLRLGYNRDESLYHCVDVVRASASAGFAQPFPDGTAFPPAILFSNSLTRFASQDLFVPLVKRLGYESSPTDPPNDKQLRTKAVEQAADAGDTV